MAAACLLGRMKAMLIQVAVALGIGALGLRHLIIGGGWRSGITKLFLAVVLVAITGMICRHKAG